MKRPKEESHLMEQRLPSTSLFKFFQTLIRDPDHSYAMPVFKSVVSLYVAVIMLHFL
jgi:hypothetical protein